MNAKKAKKLRKQLSYAAVSKNKLVPKFVHQATWTDGNGNERLAVLEHPTKVNHEESFRGRYREAKRNGLQ